MNQPDCGVPGTTGGTGGTQSLGLELGSRCTEMFWAPLVAKAKTPTQTGWQNAWKGNNDAVDVTVGGNVIDGKMLTRAKDVMIF